MTDTETRGGSLLRGTLAASGPWPLNLRARVCDLRAGFAAKPCTGGGFRWVSHNGKVLLCGDRPLEELSGLLARVRLQTWNRSVLPGERPKPYGLLFHVRSLPRNDAGHEETYEARLLAPSLLSGELGLDVGGELVLDFTRVPG